MSLRGNVVQNRIRRGALRTKPPKMEGVGYRKSAFATGRLIVHICWERKSVARVRVLEWSWGAPAESCPALLILLSSCSESSLAGPSVRRRS
jgi:hypothetical protein